MSLMLATQVLEGQTADALRTVNEMAAQGSDLRHLHRGLIGHLRSALLVSSGADLDPGYADEAAARIRELAADADTWVIVRAIKRLTTADMRQDPSSTLPLELAIVESGLEPEPTVAQRVRPSPSASSLAPDPTPAPAPQGDRQADTTPRPASTPAPIKRPRRPDPQPIAEADLPSEPTARLEAQWDALTSSLRLVKGDKFNLKALLVASNGREISEDSITLRFPHASHKERMQQELEIPASRKLIQDAFARVMGKSYDIRVELTTGAEAGAKTSMARNSPLVRAAQAMGAQVVAETPDEPADSEVQR